MIIGEAEIAVRANTAAFDDELRAGAAPGLTALESDAGGAGALAGANLRTGMKDELEKTEEDAEDAGGKMGGALKRGLSAVGSAAAMIGIPLGNLGDKADDLGGKFDKVGGNATGLYGSLSNLGKYATIGLAAGFIGVSALSVKMATDFQASTTQLSASADISTSAAKRIGDAFLGTAGTSIYSGQTIVTAYAGVAGQLGSVEGHALNTTQAMTVMKAAMDLAEGSGESLSAATSTLGKVMQAFHLDTGQAAQASDILFTAARDTGVGLGGVANTLTRLRSTLGVTSPSLGELSGLMVDLANHGETGRKAMSSMNSAMTTMLKPSTELQQALQNQNDAAKALPPSLDYAAAGYEKGTLTSAQLTDVTNNLNVGQQAQWAAFTKASDAVRTSSASIQDAGIKVTDANGKFVGMADIITQLKPILDHHTQAQQLATLATVFGTSANKTLLTTILAGPDAYDKATAAVERANSAHEAAEKQSQTLGHQLDLLKATVEDEAVKWGSVLIPVLEDAGKIFVKVSTYVLDHKAILIGLAAVIGGVLTVAIGAFVVNTMARFVGSIQTAITNVGKFITALPGMGGAATTAGGEVDTAVEGMATTTTEATATMDGDLTATQLSFATTGADAQAMAGEIGLAGTEAEGAMAGVAGSAEGMSLTTVAAGGTAEGALGAVGAGGVVAGAGLGTVALAVGSVVLALMQAKKAADSTVVGNKATMLSYLDLVGKIEHMSTSSLPDLSNKLAATKKAEDELSSAMKGNSLNAQLAQSAYATLQQQTENTKNAQITFKDNVSLLRQEFGMSQTQVESMAQVLGVNLSQALQPGDVQTMKNNVFQMGTEFDAGSGKASNLSANVVSQMSKMASQSGAAISGQNWVALGEAIPQGVANGINESANVAIAAAGNMSAAALATAQRVIRAQSPSRAFAEEVGWQIPAGTAAGINERAHLPGEATTAMLTEALGIGRTTGGFGVGIVARAHRRGGGRSRRRRDERDNAERERGTRGRRD